MCRHVPARGRPACLRQFILETNKVIIIKTKKKNPVYLRRPLGNGFVAQGLQGLHGSVVSGRLAGASLPDELMAPHRQLHEEDLGNRIVVPAARRGKTAVFQGKSARRWRPADQIVNSHSLERSQIKGAPLHQGQLLYNRL